VTKYQIDRSIVIDATKPDVSAAIKDFRQWPIWSPWLIMDRGTKLTFTETQGEVGSGYDWSGDLTGQGNMKLSTILDDEVEMDLEFIRPFKTKAKVKFDIIALGDDQTKVTWHMFGSIPFPISLFVIKSMKSGIGMDYARGLRMLKEYVETGGVASAVEIDQDGNISANVYLAVPGRGNINEDIGEQVQACFDELQNYLMLNGVETVGSSFVIYDEMNLDTGETSYLCAAPVSSDTEALEGGTVVRGELDGGAAIRVRHTGSYANLGNAWSTGMSFARYKKIKTTKSPTGIEIYNNDPDETDPEDLDTDVLLLKR